MRNDNDSHLLVFALKLKKLLVLAMESGFGDVLTMEKHDGMGKTY
jgi:hypothetical protein